MESGIQLLQSVAERVLEGWLRAQGHPEAARTVGRIALGGNSVDLTYPWQGRPQRIKVKADPYYGTDASKIGNRDLVFYRADARAYAIEAVANAATREPGWMFHSDADEIYYYYLSIAQTEAEVRAIAKGPDEVFFSELAVERDELVVLAMDRTRSWFESSFEQYPPRPVTVGAASAWYRLVPRDDLERAVAPSRRITGIYRTMIR